MMTTGQTQPEGLEIPVASSDGERGLTFRELSAGYGGAVIVSEVDLDVSPGEFLGLVGPNGAGKSTLLKAVSGPADIAAGDLRVDGSGARALGARGLARVVAVVPQSLPQTFAFTAREFVAMGRYPYLGRFQRMVDKDDKIVCDAMEQTDTIRFAEEQVDTLSGGDLQRLTLAQALAQQPTVLLLDEPTSHLDLNHQLQVLDLVRARADGGLAVLAVFHDLALAARYSDRIAVMASGRLVALGPPPEVLTPETLREVFGVRAVVGTDPVTGTVSVTPVIREEQVRGAGRGRVFVLGGSGVASALMRGLAEDGYEVTAAALNDGDVDHAVAVALGIDHVVLPPFGAMGSADELAVATMAGEADVCVICAVPFGSANLGNLRAVAMSGAPVILVDPGDMVRDFGGGEATRLLEELSRANLNVASDSEARAAVADATRGASGEPLDQVE